MGFKKIKIYIYMAYKRSYGPRRRYSRPQRKRSVVGEFAAGYRTAQKALSMVRYVKSLINVEKKQVDTSITAPGTAIPVAGAANAILLTGVAQGDTDDTRNGNKIKLSALSIKANFFRLAVAGSTANPTVRMIVFNDKNSNGVAPAIADLLDATSIIGRYNPDNAGSRFKILHDKRYSFGWLNSTTNTGAGLMSANDSIYKKCGWHVKFDGTTAAQADCVSGHLYVFLFCDTASVMEGSVTARVEYIDN